MIHVHKKTTFNNKTTIQIMISSFIFLFMSFLELYWMINRSYQFIILIVLGFLIFVSGLFMIIGIKNLIDYYHEKINNQYEEILKADKAVYLLVKKAVHGLNEEIVKIQDSKDPIFEIVEKQKSIAKLTISKNRQSTEELLNLNLKVLEELEKVLKYVELNEENSSTKKNGNEDIEKESKSVPKLYDDPNKNLTAEEIAALFDSIGT